MDRSLFSSPDMFDLCLKLQSFRYFGIINRSAVSTVYFVDNRKQSVYFATLRNCIIKFSGTSVSTTSKST